MEQHFIEVSLMVRVYRQPVWSGFMQYAYGLERFAWMMRLQVIRISAGYYGIKDGRFQHPRALFATGCIGGRDPEEHAFRPLVKIAIIVVGEGHAVCRCHGAVLGGLAGAEPGVKRVGRDPADGICVLWQAGGGGGYGAGRGMVNAGGEQ